MLSSREHCALLRQEAELVSRVAMLSEGYDPSRSVTCPPGCQHLAPELQAARAELERVSARIHAGDDWRQH